MVRSGGVGATGFDLGGDVRNWADVGELFDAATEEEKTQFIRHYVEVVELHATDPKRGTGTDDSDCFRKFVRIEALTRARAPPKARQTMETQVLKRQTATPSEKKASPRR